MAQVEVSDLSSGEQSLRFIIHSTRFTHQELYENMHCMKASIRRKLYIVKVSFAIFVTTNKHHIIFLDVDWNTYYYYYSSSNRS